MARDGVAGLPDAAAVHSPPDVICGAFNAKVWRDSGDPGWQPWDPANASAARFGRRGHCPRPSPACFGASTLADRNSPAQPSEARRTSTSQQLPLSPSKMISSASTITEYCSRILSLSSPSAYTLAVIRAVPILRGMMQETSCLGRGLFPKCLAQAGHRGSLAQTRRNLERKDYDQVYFVVPAPPR